MTSQLILNIEGRLPIGGEFQGFNGDCVEDSFMVARCSAQPLYPCNGAELDRLTKESINAGEASASGAMTNAELAWLCSKEGVAYQQIYNGGPNWNWLSFLKTFAGQYPLCMGFSNGQALPGNEQNVFGHCVAVLDIDESAQTVTIANGDSVNGRNGQLDTVTFAQLTEAQPQQITRLELNVGTPYDSYFDVVSNNEYTLKSNPNIVLHMGMLSYWRQIQGLPGLPLASETYELQYKYPGHTVAFQVFERAIMVYDPDHVVDNPPDAGACYLAHIDNPEFGVVKPTVPTPVLKLGNVTSTPTAITVDYSLE